MEGKRVPKRPQGAEPQLLFWPALKLCCEQELKRGHVEPAHTGGRLLQQLAHPDQPTEQSVFPTSRRKILRMKMRCIPGFEIDLGRDPVCREVRPEHRACRMELVVLGHAGRGWSRSRPWTQPKERRWHKKCAWIHLPGNWGPMVRLPAWIPGQEA